MNQFKKYTKTISAKTVAVVTAALALVISFQNCSADFETVPTSLNSTQTESSSFLAGRTAGAAAAAANLKYQWYQHTCFGTCQKYSLVEYNLALPSLTCDDKNVGQVIYFNYRNIACASAADDLMQLNSQTPSQIIMTAAKSMQFNGHYDSGLFYGNSMLTGVITGFSGIDTSSCIEMVSSPTCNDASYTAFPNADWKYYGGNWVATINGALYPPVQYRMYVKNSKGEKISYLIDLSKR